MKRTRMMLNLYCDKRNAAKNKEEEQNRRRNEWNPKKSF